MGTHNGLNLLIFLGIILFVSTLTKGVPVPQHDVGEHSTDSEATKQTLEIPEMVAVSSTVIPVSSLFGNPKPEATGTGEVFPYFPTFTYSRRSRFFDKSTKPDTPVRLITKNSKT